jgi:hypothetical protein
LERRKGGEAAIKLYFMSQKLLLLMLSFFLLAGTSTYESKACGSNPGKPVKNSCLPKAKMKKKNCGAAGYVV